MIHKSQIPDPFLYELWDRLCDSKIEKLTFYDGSATDHHSFRDFVRCDGTHFWALFHDREPAGCIWVNGINGRSGYLHFALFREVRGKAAITIGRFATSSIIRFKDDNDTYILDVLIGVTPKKYKLALRLVKHCGGIVRGEMPYGSWFYETDTSENAIITSVTRESTEETWQHA
jgi:hypothetical protein